MSAINSGASVHMAHLRTLAERTDVGLWTCFLRYVRGSGGHLYFAFVVRRDDWHEDNAV